MNNKFNEKSLTSGDKFLLSLSNKERVEILNSVDVNKINELVQDKEKINQSFFQVFDLEEPSLVKVNKIYADKTDNIINLLFRIEVSIFNEVNNFNYNIELSLSDEKVIKVFDEILTDSIDVKSYADQLLKNHLFKVRYRINRTTSLFYNLFNAEFNFILNEETSCDKFVDDYNNGLLSEYIEKWKVFSDVIPNSLILDKAFEIYPKVSIFNIGYERFFGLFRMILDGSLCLDEVVCLLSSDNGSNFETTDEILSHYYNRVVNCQGKLKDHIENVKNLHDEVLNINNMLTNKYHVSDYSVALINLKQLKEIGC